MFEIINLNNNEYYFPNNVIKFISEKTIGRIIFKCEDGVNFNIDKINSKEYLYTIPRGMSGQSYEIIINNESKKINIQENIIRQKVLFNGKEYNIKKYDSIYDNKTYLCLEDIQKMFANTNKYFEFKKINNSKVIINGIERRYFLKEKINEHFMYINSIYLAFDVDIIKNEDKWIIKDKYNIDLEKLDRNNYFTYMHGVILGKVNSGEIIYKKNENNVCAIASTTKLMTLLLTEECVRRGKFNYDSLVTIKEESERESLSEDGVIYLEKGKQIPVIELMHALMLPSSNESAIALACFIAGDEDKFAILMNEKCQELGLVNSYYYNASGLPYYDKSLCSGKLQNRMTASEMFKLVRYIVNNYPNLLEITSKKEYVIPTLNEKITNTNNMLWNVNNCLGLKTGTTNRAGCCLVSLCKIKDELITSIILGAESSEERTEASEILLKYAYQLLDK